MCVARYQKRAQSHAAEVADRVFCRRLRRIRERQDSSGRAIDRGCQDRSAVLLLARDGFVAHVRESMCTCELHVSDPDLVAVDGRVNTLPGQRLEGGRVRERQALRRGELDDRGGERVLRSRLRARDDADHLVLANAGAVQVVDNLGAPHGERARLVERDHVDRACRFEGLRGLDQDPARGAAAGADDDRGGRRESEGAGARDDEDRDERA